ncbi:MAG TPA: M48 family metallopeptidase [Chitinophaga sp.]|uniref:M48 family metallopeptidase n=1 Tax=Chitinophaga sp. TaxID=1869181 RepID=UPI002C091079|nr:M48 family metallopeptidase [Chitinophaga sp.]HVI43629.1 M48 family metallopeptidase [Chitinophaga sp.]
MSNPYPGSPEKAYTAYLQPNVLFKQQIVKVISYIALFFLLYILLLLVAASIATACMAWGVSLLRYHSGLLPVIPGLGLILLGGLILFFLARFLFYKRAADNPCRTEISASNHPRLFQFIAELAEETRISFPKRVFVVPEVNITVFYNSSLSGLFWPVGKNLEIGLGLVNSVSISEFKAKMAQEFAHFSQRSMKMASYVYTVNRVLYNMLYENESLESAATRWNRHSQLLGFFTHLTAMVIRGIRYLLRKVYPLIHRQYLELSREMEFHADAVAVSLVGVEAAVSSMRRIELGSYSMDHCLHRLPELAEQARCFRNIYSVQRALMTYFAAQNHLLPDEEGLPVITDTYFRTFVKSRIQLRDQWTSHPSRIDREERCRQAGIFCPTDTASAWNLFEETEILQERLTTSLYSQYIPGNVSCEPLDASVYVSELSERHQQFEYPRVFNEYYDNRSFPAMNESYLTPLPPESATTLSITALYHPDAVWRMQCFYRDQQDLETLQAIATGQIQTRVFEFEGRQYQAQSAPLLAHRLAEHVAGEQKWLLEHDRLAFRYHYMKATIKGAAMKEAIKEKYLKITLRQEYASRLNEQMVKIVHCISRIFNAEDLAFADIHPAFEELAAECRNFRLMLQEVTDCWQSTGTLTDDMAVKVQQFRQHGCVYLHDHVPDYIAIEELHELITAVIEKYNNDVIRLKKDYLEFILTLESSPE